MGFHSSELSALLAQLSVAVPFVFLPSIFYTLLDAIGWLSLDYSAICKASFMRAFGIHVAAEAIAKTIPLGVPFADSVRSVLMKRENNVDVVDCFSMSIIRRMYLGLGQGLFLLVCGIASFSVLRSIPHGALPVDGVEWIPVAAGSALLVVLCISSMLLSSSRLRLLLGRGAFLIPIAQFRGRVRMWLKHPRQKQRAGRTQALTFFVFFAYWCVEALETYTFLALLGFSASFQQVLAVEAVASTLKLGGFFLPSGIGVQDIGYAAMLGVVGCVASPVDAGGFVLLKRLKDVCWIAVGYAILAAKGIRPLRKSTIHPAIAESAE